MKYLIERIGKLCSVIGGYRYEKRTILKTKYKKGFFKSTVDAESSDSDWIEYKNGDLWGDVREHAFFFSNFTVPQSMNGKKLAIVVNGNGIKNFSQPTQTFKNCPHLILFVNGQLVQGMDPNHTEVSFAESALAGDTYDIGIDAFVPFEGSRSWLEFFVTTIDDTVNDFYYDIKVPLDVANCLNDESPDRRTILLALNETVNMVDLRVPYSNDFYNSILEAKKYIHQELYSTKCTLSKPIVSIVGHTHIDIAWKWTLDQTREKVVRSFSTVLNMMKEFPDYMFMSSQPILYQYFKEEQPELYEQIKERVKEGRWQVEGGLWIETDTNLVAGESLVRQMVYGQRFFKKEFDKDNEVLWLPDCFGQTSALPQIASKCGLKYFMTSKFGWNQYNKIPFETFIWHGTDNSEIYAQLITTKPHNQPNSRTTYSGMLEPTSVIGAWDRYQQKYFNQNIFMPFGYGDGGGGPTKEFIETQRRLKHGLPGCPATKMEFVTDYFERSESNLKNHRNMPHWYGELYMEDHRGTYTSIGKTKRYNRKTELLFQDVEFFQSLAMLLGRKYDQKQLYDNWIILLTNHFHDVLPGSSIQEVYDISYKQYDQIIASGKKMLNESIEYITHKIDLEQKSMIVFNTLPFVRDDLVCFEYDYNDCNLTLADKDGSIFPCQRISDNKFTAFVTGLPSKGFKSFIINPSEIDANQLKVTDRMLENQYFTITLNENGCITSIFDKQNSREVIKQGMVGNLITAYQDRPHNLDNWNIDIYYKEKSWDITDCVSIEVIENGPVSSAVRIERNFLSSRIIQNLRIFNNIPRIDFETEIDWHEHNIMLKAGFPVDVFAYEATYDIQFGNIKRPTHKNTSWEQAKFEVPAHKWIDVSEEGYGVSLLNDCKYGFSVEGSNMNITLLKSGVVPNNQADQGMHCFTYSLYPHDGGWRSAETDKMSQKLNQPVYSKLCEKNKGTLTDGFSLVSPSDKNVYIETIKKAEDDNSLIFRVYENHNKRTSFTLKFFKNIVSAYECDLNEKILAKIAEDCCEFNSQIKPYEIKTYKVFFEECN